MFNGNNWYSTLICFHRSTLGTDNSDQLSKCLANDVSICHLIFYELVNTEGEGLQMNWKKYSVPWSWTRKHNGQKSVSLFEGNDVPLM